MNEFEYRGQQFKIKSAEKLVKITTEDFSATLIELRALNDLKMMPLFIAGIVTDHGVEKIPLTAPVKPVCTHELYPRYGLSRKENQKRTGRTRGSNRNGLWSLRRRNEALLGRSISYTELLTKAEEYGLLDDMTLIGLEHARKK